MGSFCVFVFFIPFLTHFGTFWSILLHVGPFWFHFATFWVQFGSFFGRSFFPFYILAHFYEITGTWVGCYDELGGTIDTSYEDYVKEYGQGFSGTRDFELITIKGTYGPEHKSNIKILNINRDLYNCAIAGMKAAEKFC